MEIVKALLVGAICGGVFSALRLPIPAPTTAAGIAGVVGVFLGFLLIKGLVK